MSGWKSIIMYLTLHEGQCEALCSDKGEKRRSGHQCLSLSTNEEVGAFALK